MSAQDTRLFLRESELIVGPKVISSTPQEPADARLFRNRLKFRVKKTSESNPNQSTIQIYNTNQQSKNFLEQLTPDLKNNPRGIVFLKAGYEDFIGNIFIGDIIRIITNREGPDIVTTLECGDAEQSLKRANISIGLGPGATNFQLAQLAAAKLGVAIGKQIGFEQKTFRNGYSFAGLAKDLLDELCKDQGVDWSIQDGELQILSPGINDGQQAFVVSPQTGLLGFPTKTEKGLKFESLMNPRLRPGRAVQVNSKQFQTELGGKLEEPASQSTINSGEISKLVTCEFVGDTLEGDWKVICESVPTNIVPVISAAQPINPVIGATA